MSASDALFGAATAGCALVVRAAFICLAQLTSSKHPNENDTQYCVSCHDGGPSVIQGADCEVCSGATQNPDRFDWFIYESIAWLLKTDERCFTLFLAFFARKAVWRRQSSSRRGKPTPSHPSPTVRFRSRRRAHAGQANKLRD